MSFLSKSLFSESLLLLKKEKNLPRDMLILLFNNYYIVILASTALHNNLSEWEVERMIDSVSRRVLPLNLSSLKRLGIDEISLVKGQGKFIVVLVDLDTGKLIGLVREKRKSTIAQVLLSWGEEVLNQIEEVSIDMARIYQSLAEDLCPNAVITVDRFHITKMLNEELNQARISQKKTAEETKNS